MSARSYGQHCGVAHALDLIGERWTLLVLRELMLGPKRYRDLLERLPGMGTNLLAARLKALDAAGVVHRTMLPAPAGVAAYALTDAGQELRPALEALALWGYRLLPEPGEGGTVRAAWAALTMEATARRAGGPGVTGIVDLEVAGQRLWVRCTGTDLAVQDGPAPLPADVVARMDAGTFLALATGAATPDAADGLEVEGDAQMFATLLETFRLPGEHWPRGPGSLAGVRPGGETR